MAGGARDAPRAGTLHGAAPVEDEVRRPGLDDLRTAGERLLLDHVLVGSLPPLLPFLPANRDEHRVTLEELQSLRLCAGRGDGDRRVRPRAEVEERSVHLLELRLRDE